jgi:hypothetical protein
MSCLNTPFSPRNTFPLQLCCLSSSKVTFVQHAGTPVLVENYWTSSTYVSGAIAFRSLVPIHTHHVPALLKFALEDPDFEPDREGL